jgi:hypothetical protein
MTMDDLRRRFAELDSVVVPDLWAAVERRAGSQATERVRPLTTWRGQSGRRVFPPVLLALLAALLVVAVGGGILIGSWIERPTPTNVGTPTTTTPVLGCILQRPLDGFSGVGSVGAPECELVATDVVAHLPEGRGTPFAILVRFIVCPDLCVWPSGGRRDGAVTVEYADGGEPIEFSFTGPLETLQFEPVATTWSGPKEPASSRVDGSGPFPFTLGHCGLSWFVDFDGSFWVPVGLVDGRASAIVNAEAGEMLLLAPNLAQFRGVSGFTAQLARFPGPKHVWICR